MAIGRDSTQIAWSAEWEAGAGPFARIEAFARGQRLKNDLQTMMQAYSVFASNPKNSYGISPQFVKVADTILISTKSNFSFLPGTNELYEIIDDLGKYAESKGASLNGLPMYHLIPMEKGFEMMVALPTDKPLESTEKYQLKRMVTGNLLVAEVTAGPANLIKLFDNFEQYKTDHQLVSPAIPYLQLVTNRMQQKDTSQWITRLCYPIF
jgi:hypothetical protein